MMSSEEQLVPNKGYPRPLMGIETVSILEAPQNFCQKRNAGEKVDILGLTTPALSVDSGRFEVY